MTNFLQILRKITYPGHFIAVFLYFASNSYAQSGLLDKPVTVKAYNERLTNILDLIAAQGNFNFSYNSNLIEDRRIDLTAVNKPVREILNVIFKGTVSYKVRGNYVILIKVRSNEERNISFFVSGYVVDDETGSALSDVSIFDKVNLYSALTNKNGYYKIKVHSQDLPVKLIIEKTSYEKQFLWIRSANNDYRDFFLNPEIKPQNEQVSLPFDDNSTDFLSKPDTLKPIDRISEITPLPRNQENGPPDLLDIPLPELYYDSVGLGEKLKNLVTRFFTQKSQRIHAHNLSDTLYRNFQLSLLPFIGTNRMLSGSIDNRISINLIAGYSGGVRMVEFGGVFNFVRNNVSGTQMGGFSNIVGDNVEGNQFAGFGNIVGGMFTGRQFAGFLNVSGTFRKGLQMAPLNIVLKESNGLQMGVVNYATKIGLTGHQVGLFNLADSAERAPFGLISIVRSNGYRRFELSTDENRAANLYFKTGIKQFYNIFMIGINPIRTLPTADLGYGIGRAYRLGKAWMFNTDIVAHFFAENDYGEHFNTGGLYQIDFGFEKQIARRTAVVFGPSLKFMSLNNEDLPSWQTKPFKGIPPYDSILSGRDYTFWIGINLGLRIMQKTRIPKFNRKQNRSYN